MSNELQNDDMYLQGNLGTVRIGNASFEITKTFKGNDGTFTMTVSPFPTAIHIEMRDDIECEEIKPLTTITPTTK